MAHELGHNFGMKHDQTNCECPDPDSVCIMSSFLSKAATRFSTCSINTLKNTVEKGYAQCLFDEPMKVMTEVSICFTPIARQQLVVYSLIDFVPCSFTVFQFVEMVLLKKESNVIVEHKRYAIVMTMLLQKLHGVRVYSLCFVLIALFDSIFCLTINFMSSNL